MRRHQGLKRPSLVGMSLRHGDGPCGMSGLTRTYAREVQARVACWALRKRHRARCSCGKPLSFAPPLSCCCIFFGLFAIECNASVPPTPPVLQQFVAVCHVGGSVVARAYINYHVRLTSSRPSAPCATLELASRSAHHDASIHPQAARSRQAQNTAAQPTNTLFLSAHKSMRKG